MIVPTIHERSDRQSMIVNYCDETPESDWPILIFQHNFIVINIRLMIVFSVSVSTFHGKNRLK